MIKKKEKLSTEEKEMVDEIESYMKEVDSQPDVAESPLPPELSIMPQIRAARMCTAYRKKPTAVDLNIPIPAAPIINAGPELLQKISRREASSELMSCCRLSPAM